MRDRQTAPGPAWDPGRDQTTHEPRRASHTVENTPSRTGSTRDQLDRSPRRQRGDRHRESREREAVAYLRRSTDRQEQSIPDQQRAIEVYCQHAGLRLVRCYTDDAISGTSSVGRKAFQQLIQDAQHPGCDFGTIVCYDVKRFGRVDNDEAGYYRHVLRQHGVQVLYASENFAGDGTDDLLRPVKQWQAREESKDLSKVCIRGLVTKSSTGHWMGGAPPYGFDLKYESQSDQFLFYLRYNPDGSKLMFDKAWRLLRTLQRGETVTVSRKDHCRLVPGEKPRVNVVRRIFRMYNEDGLGFKGIADRLNRDRVPSARGPAWAAHYSGQWAMTTVRAILLNPAYAGDMVWNRRTDARFNRIQSRVAVERKDVHARRLENNDPSDWTVVRDAHPPLVSRRTFELAKTRMQAKPMSAGQRGIDQRRGVPAQRSFRKVGDLTGPRARFLLSGLVTCARCESRYEGFTQRAHQRDAAGNRLKVYVYACGGYIRRGKSVCSLGQVPQADLEETVIDAVLEYYRRYDGDEGRLLLARTIREQTGLENELAAQTRQQLTAELRQVEATTRNLLDNVTPATRGVAERRLGELERDRGRLIGKIESIERVTLGNAELRDWAAKTTRYIEVLPFALRHGPLDKRHAAIRRCLNQVRYDPRSGEATIKLHAVPELLPG